MDSSSHDPGVDDAKVPKRAATSPGRVDTVPETVASAPTVLSVNDEGKEAVIGQGKPQQQQQQQQKPALKKPDKLAPCPRCDSLDTKFCYYNNYNVNQPRHFCKNCQRYWTAGGTLRNVPVGAGRRKNKHGSLQARHGALPEQVRLEPLVAQPRPRSHSVPEQISPPLASSSSDPSSQERGVSSGAVTHASSMHAAEAARRQYIPEPQASISSDHGGSRLHDAEHGASCDPEAEKEDCAEACTSSAPGYSCELDAAPTAQEAQSTIQVPATTTLQPVVAGVVRGLGVLDGSVWTAAPAPFGLFNGSWPFGYNVGWSGPPPGTPGTPICPPGSTLVACQPAVGGLTTWSAPPNGLWPGVCWGSTLIPGMPPGLVGSPWMSPGWGGGWSVPWGGAEAAAAASASLQAAAGATAPTSAISSRLPIRPVLSKHPRDRLELERVESSLWVPKMVKLHDPGNIPRSSVWTAVGAENRLDAPGSNFKAFLPVRNNNNNDNNNNKIASSITTSGETKKQVAS